MSENKANTRATVERIEDGYLNTPLVNKNRNPVNQGSLSDETQETATPKPPDDR